MCIYYQTFPGPGTFRRGGKECGMRFRRTKTIMHAEVTTTRARLIKVRAIVTFWFQKLIFASCIPAYLVTFPPPLEFPGPGSGGKSRPRGCQSPRTTGIYLVKHFRTDLEGHGPVWLYPSVSAPTFPQVIISCIGDRGPAGGNVQGTFLQHWDPSQRPLT